MKKMIQKVLWRLGLDVRKIKRDPNIQLYLKVYPEDSVQNRKFYNIGAGHFSHPCWTNVDFVNEWYAGNTEKTESGINYDLLSLEPLPIESESAEVVYTSHTVEHITDEAAQNMFNEALRILKPKGFFRVTTPNIDLEYRAYKENDRFFFHWIDAYSDTPRMKKFHLTQPYNEASLGQVFLAHFATSASTLYNQGNCEKITDDDLQRAFNELEYEEALNYFCSKCSVDIQRKYTGNHMNWWNKDKMIRMLKQAGFRDVYLSAYGQSFCPVLRDTHFFDNTGPELSIYVEARK